ncbi:DNA polymerase III subunit alpha [Fodinicurvata sediminis]|uniref:DNA polymerase III subunit alpha n=1 Tax=Fodinicurvata sediminis TaxID=1121832 RepID=UPI0003B72969|nr:DNA polymerase III subunit alpha [Fodinicurvata sediminis]
MAHSDFVHLRVHSAYSLSEGAIRLKQLISLCRDHAMPAVAMTDTGNLFGALEFSMAATDQGVQPIVGTVMGVRLEAAGPFGEPSGAPYKVVLLVRDEQGYRNLLKLISKSFLETPDGDHPHVLLDTLIKHNSGLILLTGGIDGPIADSLLANRGEQAENLLLQLQETFSDRLYIELQRHGLSEEDQVEQQLVELAYRHEIPLVATNDAFFPTRDQHEAHDALICIAESTYVVESNRRQLTPEHYFKSAEEMRALFSDLPEAVDNTIVIARRCSYFPEKVDPILPAFPSEADRSETEELKVQSRDGLERRLEEHVFLPDEEESERGEKAEPYRNRLEYELGIIEQMGFPGYFLIVADFIKWAKSQGIPVGPGRGSGAGSVVAWALTITDLDPLRWGLLFERFLNPERISMPDFDVDFCQERRDEVISYVQQQYGSDMVAQIITFGKLQARAVLRDVGRVLQLPYGLVDRLCKMVPNNPANPVTLQEAIDGEPRLQEAMESEEQIRRMIDIALKLEGLYRHASTHAAGVVIGDRPLDELIPLYRDPRSDMPVTQFNMKYVELAGLVKFDFLGLKTLSVLARARDLIQLQQPEFDLEGMPLDDVGAYELMSRGETVGVFQLESSGMRDALRRLKPDRFEDVIAMVALYRPGPMENIPSYIRRKKGEEEPDYLYPTLEPILRETFGIMIYQEQVMQIAQELAGYSLGAADMLRRAMGKKIKSEMDAQREIFVEGAVAKGVEEQKARSIFELVNKFAGYGFNKSHAAAYALVAYQTAYLKANYPVEFMAASMTFELGNTDKLNVFRQELVRMGVPLLTPDINRSHAEFSVELLPDGQGKGIRYALGAIKNVGSTAMEALVQEREANGPYRSLSDLAQRLDARQINKRAIENLACAGAFDSLNSNRQQVFLAAETLVRQAASAATERDAGQFSLLGGNGDQANEDIRLSPVSDWPAMERLKHEFEAIGFYLSAHPLDSYENLLQRRRVVSFAELPRAIAGGQSRQALAGIIVAKQERTSKKGSRFAFVQMSDASGVFEVTVFSELLGRCRELLESGRPLLVTVSVERQAEGDDLRLTAQDFEDLEESLAKTAAGLKVYLEGEAPLQDLRNLLDRETRGRSQVTLVLTLSDGREVELDLPGGFSLSAGGRQAIKSIPGVVVEDL